VSGDAGRRSDTVPVVSINPDDASLTDIDGTLVSLGWNESRLFGSSIV